MNPETTKEEMERAVESAKEFVAERMKEIDGKSVSDIFTLDIAAIVFACTQPLIEGNPLAGMLKEELHDAASLLAYSLIKHQELVAWKDDS